MKCIRFAIVWLLLLSSTVLPSEYYYYEPSGRVDLELATTAVTVRVDETQFTSWAEMIGGDPALSQSIEPGPIADSFYVLAVNEGYDVDSLLQRLRERQDIMFAGCPTACCGLPAV